LRVKPNAERNRMILCKYKKISGRVFIYLFIATMIVAPWKMTTAEDFNKIKKDLNDRHWEVRLAAVEKLGNINDEKALNLLMQVAATRAEYWLVKTKAIQLLGETADPKAVTLLISIFNDPFLNWECPSIKSYTAVALGNFKGDERVFDTLIEGINDRELLTREASIKSLGKIGNPKAVSYLLQALSDQNVTIKLSVIKALENIGDPQAITHLQRIEENNNDSLIKERAREALDSLNNKR
jgi:HEAT repeat protein